MATRNGKSLIESTSRSFVETHKCLMEFLMAPAPYEMTYFYPEQAVIDYHIALIALPPTFFPFVCNTFLFCEAACLLVTWEYMCKFKSNSNPVSNHGKDTVILKIKSFLFLKKELVVN